MPPENKLLSGFWISFSVSSRVNRELPDYGFRLTGYHASLKDIQNALSLRNRLKSRRRLRLFNDSRLISSLSKKMRLENRQAVKQKNHPTKTIPTNTYIHPILQQFTAHQTRLTHQNNPSKPTHQPKALATQVSSCNTPSFYHLCQTSCGYCFWLPCTGQPCYCRAWKVPWGRGNTTISLHKAKQ